MIINEISKARMNFYIVSGVGIYKSGKDIFQRLRNIDYIETEDEILLLDIFKFESTQKRHAQSGFLGVFNNNLILKDAGFIGINSEKYIEKLTEIFPEQLITEVIQVEIEGHESVTGGIIKAFKSGKQVLDVRKTGSGNNHDTLFDSEESFIPSKKQSTDIELDKNSVLSIINEILEKTLSASSLSDCKLKRFEQIRFNNFNFSNYITVAIRNNLPEINDLEIASAWVGGMLRKMLSKKNKPILFPNTKEIKELIANVINDLTDNTYKYVKSKSTFTRKTNDFEDEILFGGSDRVGFNITFLKRFINIENRLNSIEKALTGNDCRNSVTIGFRLEHEMQCKISLGGSWNNFATQLYYFLKYGLEICIPNLNKLEDIYELNNFVNHSNSRDNCFTGGRYYKEWKNPQLANCIVAILANDKNKSQIFEEKFFSFIDNVELKEKYRIELEKII
jgi:hypothetical protein